jgi:hypothetical protein
MLLLSQGCCFIQSLLFIYVHREDFVNFSRIYFDSLLAVHSNWYSVRTLISQQHPPGRPSMSRCCKQGFHLSEHFQKTLYCKKDRRFQIPCQPFGQRVIPSGRPSVHCSIRSDNVYFHPDLTLYREASIPACIHPDLSAARPNVHQ